MVEVFKTNIQTTGQAKAVQEILFNTFPDSKINFDLDNCEKILRIEDATIHSDIVISLVNKSGFMCDILEDKICVKKKNLIK